MPSGYHLNTDQPLWCRQSCPQGTRSSGTRCRRGTSSRDRPCEKPVSFACSCHSPFSAPLLLGLRPGPGAWCLLDTCGLLATNTCGSLATNACDGEQLTGAPDEPAHPPGGPQQDLKPSHEEDGADKAHQLVVLLLLGSLELAVCFLRFLCALFGKWVEAPGPLGLLLPPAVVGVPWLLLWGGEMWAQAGDLGWCGDCWGCLCCWRQRPGVPSGGAEPSPVGCLGAGESSTPTGDWEGNEEANPKHCIVARELFSSVCFSPQEKTGFFWESDSCFVTSDITTALLFAVWFVLQVKSSRQRFSSVLGSSQKYAFISPQKYT